MLSVRDITWLESFFSLNIKYIVASSRQIPWPQSPNITANRKGKVTIVNTLGLASWYLATLQCSDQRRLMKFNRQTLSKNGHCMRKINKILPAELIKETHSL